MNTTLLAVITGLCTIHPPSGEPRGGHSATVRHHFDPATGRDLLNYPPHRLVDIEHQRIELTIPDMNTPAFTATTTIRFTPIAGPVGSLTLHAADLNIRSARSDGRTASITAHPGDDDLLVTLDPAPAPGQSVELVLEYECTDPAEGMIWTPQSARFPDRAASLHTQGEPESNRYWFPTFDFPSERFTSEVVVHVPDGFTAVSNGRLVSQERGVRTGSDAVMESFHFLQERPHAPYLVSLSVGKWDVVDLAPAGSAVPMPVYAPVGQRDRVERTFGRTGRMIALFERLFDEPYPWKKYAQVVVTNFAWGGMENTSATTLYDTVCLDAAALLDGDQDEFISHELAHQWFGDLITCRSWEHIWLNEAWATYSEALWQQYRDTAVPPPGSGAGAGSGLRADEDAYQYAIWQNFRSVVDDDSGRAPYQPAMVSKEYDHPEEVFDRASNPYPKGAAVLHMLRRRLGDDLFWRGTSLYVDRCRDRAVETHEFRLAMEEVSATSLQRFIDQWCYRPGVPRLKVTPTWNSELRELQITVEQTQVIDGPNPAFAFDLPVLIDDGRPGSPRTVVVPCDAKAATVTVPQPLEPRRFVVDPDLTVLAEIDLVQPTAAFIATLRQGPTLGARLHAARQLGRLPGSDGVAALVQLIRDERADRGLRMEAAEALGRLANPRGVDTDDAAHAHANVPEESAADPAAFEAIRAAVTADLRDARVRRALVRQAGIAGPAFDRQSQRALAGEFLKRYPREPSYAVRAEMLRAVGRLREPEASPLLAEALQTDSQHDQIRRGAVDGLACADFPDSFELVVGMTAPDRSPGVRQTAIEAVGKLAHRDRERTFNLLSALANDANLRTRRAAVSALLELDDPRARPTVEQWCAAARSRADKRWGLVELRKAAEAAAASDPH